MGQPYIGEVKLISWNYAPRGWAFCNGALMAINQNQALFVILGTTYGGNGQTTFALPDLRGRAALHMGSGFNTGNIGGEESHTLIKSEMPAHNHFVNASDTQGNQNTVQGNILAREVGNPYGGYPASPSITTLGPRHHHQYRRQPASRKPATVSRDQFHYRPAGHLPVAKLENPP